VLAGYQLMLKLTGKDIETAFPEGTWQFYCEFGLREDTSRHSCETTGFQQAVRKLPAPLSPADELAVWVAASAWLLQRYDKLLHCVWTEHTTIRFLTRALRDPAIPSRWAKRIPYAVPDHVDEDFAPYRARVFQLFCQEELHNTDPETRAAVMKQWKEDEAERAEKRAAFAQQMTLHAALEPGEHGDIRTPIPADELCIGVVFGGRYFLWELSSGVTYESIRPWCASVLNHGTNHRSDTPPSTLDSMLVGIRRSEQARLRRALDEEETAEVAALRRAPIILNWDVVDGKLPLSDVRAGRRGIGDHALTVFRTSQSMVFDLSHIFFDGAWGVAVMEILTSQAIRYAKRFAPPDMDMTIRAIAPLKMQIPPALRELSMSSFVQRAYIPAEVSAETTAINLRRVQQVRDTLMRRNMALRLTVNDLLILYRSIFGALYSPSPDLMVEIKLLETVPNGKRAMSMIAEAMEASRIPNPAILIPIDASSVDPKERIYPTTFRNPFPNVWEQHTRALEAVQKRPKNASDIRLEYLTTLHAFGVLMEQHKIVSLRGESISTATLKLLGHLPAPLQRLLESVPGRVDVVNDAVRGQEVFSNVGRVASGSSLTRFNTAKDDNEKKTLAWGVLTDAAGVLHLSLRDFRPHVGVLTSLNKRELAKHITADYLNAFSNGFNQFIADLLTITQASVK
jgi:hypothetical protein